MIISRYLTKEVFVTLLGVTTVLLLILLSNQLVRYLSYAAVGKISASIVLKVLGLEIPSLLAALLPLGLYLGIILTYGRLYADSEMRVLHACGLSARQLTFITGLLIFTVTAIVMLLTLWINPWIAFQKETLKARTDNVLDTVMPGRFQASGDGKRVFYVESMSRNRKEARNLFIADQGNHKTGDDNMSTWRVVAAEKGSQMKDPDSNDRFIVATDGFRYEGAPGQNDFKIIQFEKYAIRLPRVMALSRHQREESISTKTLLEKYDNPDCAAELQWRLSIPMLALLLGWLAVPLSHIQPRWGRYSQLFPAILIYIIYMNLLFVGRNWVEQKVVSIALGMWWIHLLALLFIVGYVIYHSGWDVRKMMRRST